MPLPVAGRPARGAFQAFDSLGVIQFRWYLLAFVSSAFGFQNQVVVRGWLAYDLTGSPLALGTVEFVSSIANVSVSPLGGVLADHIERRRLIAAMQGVLGLSGLVLGLLVTLDAIRYWHLLVAAAVTGSATGALMPARFALVYNVAGPQHISNASAVMSGAVAAMRLLAPAIGGVMIKVVGADAVYYLMAGGFLISVPVLLHFMGPVAQEHRLGAIAPLREFAEGLAHLWRHHLVLGLIVTTLLVEALGESVLTQMPAFAGDVLDLGPEGYGLLLTMVGVGALTGSMAVASMSNVGQRGSAFLTAGILWGAFSLAFALSPNMSSALPLAMILGAASAAFSALSNILVQNTTDDAYRGRMLSFRMANVHALGALAVGALAEHTGIRFALFATGAFMAASACAIASWRRDLRRLT